MSDRIEDKERARVEAARLAASQADKARLGKEGDFRKIVSNLQATKAQVLKQQTQQQDRRGQQNSRLQAKSGMANQGFSSKMQVDGDDRNVVSRRDRADQDANQDAKRDALRSATQPIRHGAKQQNNAQSQGQNKRPAESDSKKTKGPPARGADQILAAHSGIQTVHGLHGVQAGQSAATGSAGAPTTQKMIDQMVKAVRKYHDPKGIGTLEVDLNDDVLAGAKLRLQSSGQGISLQVQSDNVEVSRLFSSGATANELSKLLGLHKINLRSLEVNGHRVLG
jgi:hypothetical protein